MGACFDTPVTCDHYLKQGSWQSSGAADEEPFPQEDDCPHWDYIPFEGDDVPHWGGDAKNNQPSEDVSDSL